MTGIATIRGARLSEREALTALHRRSSYVWEQDRVHFDAHPEIFGVAVEAIAAGDVRVALAADGELLGFATVDRATGELDDLFVAPEHMRMGVGRALVEDAAARARAAGCRELSVTAHPRNFPFYEHVGFVAAEPAATRFGPAFRMRRALPDGG